jgi:hypothetical protein
MEADVTNVEEFWKWISQFRPIGTRVIVRKIQMQTDSDILWTPTPEYNIHASKNWGKNSVARSFGQVLAFSKKVKSVECNDIVFFDWETALPVNIGSLTRDIFYIEENDIDLIIGKVLTKQIPTGEYNH